MNGRDSFLSSLQILIYLVLVSTYSRTTAIVLEIDYIWRFT